MGNYRRFTGGSGGGTFFKFTIPGDCLEGKLLGFHDGKFGPVGKIETEEGELQFGCNTGLINCFEEAYGSLDNVPEVNVRITFKAFVKTKTGGTFKKYELDVDDPNLTDNGELPI